MYVIIQAYYDFFRRKIIEQTETHTTIISILQIITLFYALFALNYLTKSFLVPILQEIIQRYKISSKISPLLISMTSMMPEFFINLFSVLNGGAQMASFGFIIITGSSVFNFTIFIGITAIFSSYYVKRDAPVNLNLLTKNLFVYMVVMLFLATVFWNNSITLLEPLVLLLILSVYIHYINNDQQIASRDKNTPTSQRKPTIRYLETRGSIEKYTIFEESEKQKCISYSCLSGETSDEEEDIELMNDTKPPGITPNYYEQTRAFKSFFPILVDDTIDRTYAPLQHIFGKTIYLENMPVFGFVIASVFCLMLSKYTIYISTVISQNTSIPLTFIGSVVYCWTRNAGDIMETLSNFKEIQTNDKLISLFTSQIFGILFCAGAPWLINTLYYGSLAIHADMFKMTFLSFSVAAILSRIISYYKYKLSQNLGFLSIALYVLFIVLVCVIN